MAPGEFAARRIALSQKSTHLLLIHQVFMSHADTGGTRHIELGSRFRRAGNQVTIVASDTVYHTGKLAVEKRSWVSESEIDGIRVLRCLTYNGLHKNFKTRILAYFSFMFTSVFAAMKAKDVDVVMGTTPPLFQCVSAWLVAALRRKPFLLEVRDLWPEFAIDAGILKNPVLIWLSRRLERFLYNRADHILVNSPAYRDYMIDLGYAPAKVSLIANGVDPAMFDPTARGEKVREEYHIGDRFLVLYAGAIGMMNNLETMIGAAELLRNDPRFVFMIVGDGKDRKKILELAASKNLENVIMAPPQPKSAMKDYLAAADACVAGLKNLPTMTTTYPNKVFDYMAAGRPTVLAIDGVIRKVVEEANGGIFCQPGDPRAMADAICVLGDNPVRAREMGIRARHFVSTHFNRDHQARDFVQLIERMHRAESALTQSEAKAATVTS